MKGVKTTGNVFKSLGFASAAAENLRVRAIMMNALIAHSSSGRGPQAFIGDHGRLDSNR